MAEIRLTRVDQGQTKIRNVPIAVTPEGFWCCPSPVVFQRSLKTQNHLNKSKSSPPNPSASVQKKQTSENEKKPGTTKPRTGLVTNDQRTCSSDAPVLNASVSEKMPRPKIENVPRKVSIEFGESGTSDLKVILLGKQGFAVKLSVHRSILMDNSSYFAHKISEQKPIFPCLEIDECEDVEIYVETVGLMYCIELKQQLIKQSVARVLRILKVAEQLGFTSCIQSCLEYLEAVPWVGEEEEEKVVSSVLRLQDEGIGVTPVLKRVSSHISKPPKDTLSYILELVLKSNEERGRRETKSIVLKLLRENNCLPSSSGLSYLCRETLYASCRSCLDLLLSLFKQAAEPNFTNKPVDYGEPVVKLMAIEADNLTWLLDILADWKEADEFAVMWARQQELASLHYKLPIMSRHHVSTITARLFVGIGRGELLPSKDTRHLLLQTWLQPLINDYNWLQHGSRSFDRKVVEEGIGRTILTLPLEDQQSILLFWLESFLKAGDNCPNLQRAFEVWWRRTFIRPYAESGYHQQEQ
ncbi:BTB/POZ domain-containing protein At3g50780-like [Olea europaea var. sylvestris]|uniref:BTB/POZ domain-containing protein At3g50780-like n=1 Tax=Olea europaea var. sylvestris TaxID=158386 RepID=UPI000C1D1F28|nr:BTB/POZ domain-containing protein At3g50780-like [Olea europaea var. sylvestris]